MEKYILIVICNYDDIYTAKVFDTEEEAIDILNKYVEKKIKTTLEEQNYMPDIIKYSDTEAEIRYYTCYNTIGDNCDKDIYRIFEINIEELDKYKNLESMLGISFETIVELCNRTVPENCKYPRKTRILTDETVDEWDRYKSNRDNNLLFTLPYDIKKVKTLYYLDYDGKIYEVPKANSLTISVNNDGKIIYTIRCFTFTEKEMKERVFTTPEEAKEKQRKKEI